MFTAPCETQGCTESALEDQKVCAVCHDRNGYPEGWSRSKDQTWLDDEPTDSIRLIPIKGPGCNSHPVTPRPDLCQACTLAVAA